MDVSVFHVWMKDSCVVVQSLLDTTPRLAAQRLAGAKTLLLVYVEREVLSSWSVSGHRFYQATEGQM